MRHYISLGLIILLSSCAMTKNYYPQTVQSWRGGNDKNLIKQWGQPDNLMASKNGNNVLVYKSSTYRPGTGMSSSPPCTTLFQVNKMGTIVDAQYEGTRCFGDSNFSYYRSNHEAGNKA